MHAKLTVLLAAVTAVYAPSATFAQAPGVLLNLRQFEIPFSVDASGSRPVHVELFVSRDRGQRWELFARQPATGRHFQFTAPDDGQYWFATRTIDAAGNPHPAGSQIAPQLQVTVDTARPQLSLQAEVDAAGRVHVDYVYADAAPSAGGVELQYMTDTNRTQWIPVAVPSAAAASQTDGTRRGQVQFLPQTDWRYLNVRMVALDQAGNQAVVVEQIERPRIARAPAGLAAQTAPGSAPVGASAAAISGRAGGDGGYAMMTPQPSPAAVASNSTEPTAAPSPLAPAATANPYVDGYADSNRSSTHYRGLAPSGPLAAGPAFPPGDSLRALPVSQPVGTPPGGDLYARHSPTLTPPALTPPATTPPATTPPAIGGSAAAAVPRWAPPAGEEASGPVPPSSAMRPISIETLPTPAGVPEQEYPVGNGPAAPIPSAAGGGYQSDRPDLQSGPEAAAPSLPPVGSYVPATPGPSTPDSAGALPSIAIDESEVRQSRSRQFSLDYEVEAVGSKGIDEVELWGSSDGGRSWSNWGSDPDRQSPFDIETVNSGLYGFCIVVVGGNGLTSRRPQPGDRADIYVRVDDTAPNVRLLAARYGEADEAGSLVIEYAYEDDNPASRPVSLSFSENRDGPWTTIATGLDNTGRYAWPADPRLPRQIYLRIEGVDRAGNVGVQSRDTPVAVQGLAPRARIRGFQPIGP